MALAKHLRGVKLFIKVGDGADPEVFAHPCLINASRGIELSADVSEITVPDCSDPDLMAWTVREKRALSATISGGGVLNTTDTETFFNWMKSALAKNVRVELGGVSAGNGGGYIAGAFHLTQFSFSGDRGGTVECSLTLQSTGDLTWTDAT